MSALDTVIRERGIRSLADIPCGDFNWMPEVLTAQPGLDYVGYDVVPALIRDNRLHHPAHDFRLLDITRAAPAHADLVFSKDLLNHLTEADVWAALENMAASGADWLLVTTNRGFDNVDLDPTVPHASRLLDLEAQPYSLPEPVSGDHYLLLYRMADVARRLAMRATS
ncbi:MAG: class I SAM-dependent methyltransferase [Alphaproteobacteria bacterium]|nr:class I SAM-dependent methyltransferase [Alphaproteobacteria bacterium]